VWLVTKLEFSADVWPYVAVVPYFTCELVPVFVVHVIVAPLAVILLDATPLIVGSGVVAAVVNVKSPLNPVSPFASTERTRK
jgi:hypothetical protein